ncbi:uncharacterized protein [Primulina eburnea]|uniref:uncharacterized protein n=1 Tax=Primulina eburnea TaxID=1245227 RepID=UPI003C6C1CA6
MEGKTSLQSPATRRQPLLTYKAANYRIQPENASGCGCGGRSDRRSRMGEAAGECAAVCCCCPCGMVQFFLLAAYRLPRCLWRRKKRRNVSRNRTISSYETEMNQQRISTFGLWRDEDESTGDKDHGTKTDVVAWENEIWHGFWRTNDECKNDFLE